MSNNGGVTVIHNGGAIAGNVLEDTKLNEVGKVHSRQAEARRAAFACVMVWSACTDGHRSSVERLASARD